MPPEDVNRITEQYNVQKQKKIRAILRIYEEIDCRSAPLGRYSPVANGYNKIPREVMEKLSVGFLEQLHERYRKEIVLEIMHTEMDMGAICTLYCDFEGKAEEIEEWWDGFKKRASDFVSKIFRFVGLTSAPSGASCEPTYV